MSAKIIKIIADGSIIAIANAEKYNATLQNQVDWTWRQLTHFLFGQNRDNLIVFSTAFEDEWTFEFIINGETNQPYFRKFEQSIEVTNGILHFVNWTDLTSSLQFENTTIPEEFNSDLNIDLVNGFYRIVVKQLFDNEDYDYDPENKTNYIVELFLESKNPNINAETILWTEDFPNDDSIFLSTERNEFDDLLDNMMNENN